MWVQRQASSSAPFPAPRLSHLDEQHTKPRRRPHGHLYFIRFCLFAPFRLSFSWFWVRRGGNRSQRQRVGQRVAGKQWLLAADTEWSCSVWRQPNTTAHISPPGAVRPMSPWTESQRSSTSRWPWESALTWAVLRITLDRELIEALHRYWRGKASVLMNHQEEKNLWYMNTELPREYLVTSWCQEMLCVRAWTLE